MNIYRQTYGYTPYNIEIVLMSTGGNGMCALVTGGVRAHNGGTAMAVPRLKSNAKHDNDLTADVSILCAPHHKDTILGAELAKKIAIALNETVSLTIGVHVEHANALELELLHKNAHAAVEMIINDVKNDEITIDI